MDMSLSKLWELVKDREAWHAAVRGIVLRQFFHHMGRVCLPWTAHLPPNTCPTKDNPLGCGYLRGPDGGGLFLPGVPDLDILPKAPVHH